MYNFPDQQPSCHHYFERFFLSSEMCTGEERFRSTTHFINRLQHPLVFNYSASRCGIGALAVESAVVKRRKVDGTGVRHTLESNLLLCTNITEPITCGAHRSERILALLTDDDGVKLGNHKTNPMVGTFHEIEMYIMNTKLEPVEASQIDSVSIILRVEMTR